MGRYDSKFAINVKLIFGEMKIELRNSVAILGLLGLVLLLKRRKA